MMFASIIVQPIDYIVLTWLALALASTAYVAVDQFRGNTTKSSSSFRSGSSGSG